MPAFASKADVPEGPRPGAPGPDVVSRAERPHTRSVADDLVLEQLRAIRKDIAGLATREDVAASLATIRAELKADLEALRGEMLRHFVEVETRIATEVHELIGLLRDLIASRDRLAARLSQLEADVEDLKRRRG
jgi:hypothetical protein